MPWDTRYETRVGEINRGRDDSLAGLQNDENRIKQDFGFDDPSNPFNRLKMMERMYQQSKTGTTNSMAAQGQLYSGALERQQDDLSFRESGDRDSLRRNYDDLLGGIQARRLGLTTGADEDVSNADYDRILAAMENRPDPSTLPGPAVAPKPAKRPKKKIGTVVSTRVGLPSSKKRKGR